MNAPSNVLQMMPDFIAKNELVNLIGKLPVKVGTHIRFINLMNILYIRACGNYVDIAIVSGEILHTKEQIADIENRLPRNLFMRVHRSFIINKEHVKEIGAKQNDYELTLINDVTITSGSTYRKHVREHFLLSPDSERESSANLRNSGTADAPPQSVTYQSNQEQSKNTQIRICVPGDEHALTLLGRMTCMETYADIIPDKDILAYCANQHAPGIYQAWLENTEVRIWLVEIDQLPVGYLVLMPAKMPCADPQGKDIEVERVFILKRFREHGLGKLLMTEAINHAKQNGYRRLVLGVPYRFREPSFYSQIGFKPLGQYACHIGDYECMDTALGLNI